MRNPTAGLRPSIVTDMTNGALVYLDAHGNKIFDSTEYAKWKSYRDSEDARFVNLVMPRVLSRLPYGAATTPVCSGLERSTT